MESYRMRAILVALILLALFVLVLGCARRCLRHRDIVRLPRVLRRWRPRTPDDCALCRLADTGAAVPLPPTVRPWREGRNRRGAPRRISTDGFACRKPRCRYYGIIDARIHALVADGHHGRSDRILDFQCRACGSRVTARWGTALYQLKTPPSRIGEVLSALAEGLDIGAAVRVFGHSETTITRWRDRAAQHADRVHRHFLHGLHLPHLQLDEIRARLRRRDRVTWLWLALDPGTKLIPALALGPRTQHTAHTLVHALRAVLAPTCIPVFTTDGLRTGATRRRRARPASGIDRGRTGRQPGEGRCALSDLGHRLAPMGRCLVGTACTAGRRTGGARAGA